MCFSVMGRGGGGGHTTLSTKERLPYMHIGGTKIQIMFVYTNDQFAYIIVHSGILITDYVSPNTGTKWVP